MLADLSVNFPVFSAVLLLIAGVLVGYSLWVPLRGDSDAIAQQLGNLRDQNEDLQDALREQRDAYARLEQKHSEQLNEWTSLRSSNQRMEAAILDQGGVREDLEAGVKSLHELRDAKLQELEQEKQKRLKLEHALRQSRAALVELKSANEDYRHLQSKYDSLLEKYEMVRALAKELGDEREQIACELVTATEQMQHAYRERQLSEDSASETGRTVDQLKEAVRHQRARADRLQGELDDTRAELGQQRAQHQALEAEVAESKKAVEQNQRLQDTVLEQQNHLVELQRAQDESRGQFQQLLADRDATSVQLESAQEIQGQLQDDLVCHQRTLDTMERQRDEFQSDVLVHANRVKELEDELQQARVNLRNHDQLRQRNLAAEVTLDENQQRLKSLKLDRDEHARELAAEKNTRQDEESRRIQAERENEQLRGEREQLAASLTQAEKSRVEAERALEEQTGRLSVVAKQIAAFDALSDEVQSLREQVAAFAASDAEANEKLLAAREQMQSESARAEDLRQRLAESHERLLELREDQAHDLRRFREERDSARESAERGKAIIAELREELKEGRLLVEELETEREQVLAQLRRNNVMLESHIEESDIERPLTQVHGRRGVVYTREPERKDDLTRISGIGNVLEERLNEFGIYTYAQIRDWDPAVVAEFSKLLAFPDRITRDDWLGQARRFHDDRHRQSDAA